MLTTRTRIKLLAVAALMIGGVAAAQTPAVKNALKPSVVVTVNLSKVLEGLQQRADAEARLKAIADGMLAEDTKRQGELKEYEKKLKDFNDNHVPFDDPQRQQVEGDAAQLSLQYTAWARFQTNKIDIERSLLLQDLYRDIKKEAASLSQTNGYDIVLVDDSQGELLVDPESRQPREAQVRMQIQGRRMLYANPVIDITDALITRMNNAWAAGAKPAA